MRDGDVRRHRVEGEGAEFDCHARVQPFDAEETRMAEWKGWSWVSSWGTSGCSWLDWGEISIFIFFLEEKVGVGVIR